MLAARTKQLIGAAFAVVSMVGLVVALQQFNIFSPRATNITPDLITVSNTTETSATITWRTVGIETLTGLQWGKTTALGKLETDARDQKAQTLSPRSTHVAQLSGLTPNTTYYYRIVSGETVFPSPDTEPLAFKTLPTTTQNQLSPLTLYGDLSTQGSDIVIFAYVPTATGFATTVPLSTTLNSDGTWYINAALARKTDGSSIKPTDKTPITILAISGTENLGFIGTMTPFDNPYTITPNIPLTQGALDQILLGSVPSIPATATPTPSTTLKVTQTVAPTIGYRQDVPLRPAGTSPSTTPIPGAALSREQLFTSFAIPSVSNVTDSSLSIMFLTSTPKVSSLNWGTAVASLTSTRLDDKDSISVTARYLHHYTLTGLTAHTAYYLKAAPETTIRTFTTPLKIAAPSGQTIITGTIKNALGECLVRTQIKRDSIYSSPITTLPNQSYAWAINIMPVRTSNLEAYLIPTATDTVLTTAFCVTSTGNAYYRSDTTTVQKAVTSGITLTLAKLE